MDYLAHYEKSQRIFSQGLHAHDYYEIYIHLEGGRYYCVDDQIFELRPNQLLIIHPLHMHGLVCDRDLVDYERCYLYLSPEMLQKCDLNNINLSGMLENAQKKHRILYNLSDEETGICKTCLQKAEVLSENRDKNSLEIFSCIFQLLQIMLNHLETGEKVLPKRINDNPIVRVLHYINENFTQNITLKSISKEFHMSSSSLSHNFRDYVNQGVYEYILYKRIILAKELMYSKDSLTEIAFKCGFSDYSNFLRVFQKQVGVSPSKYRKMN